MLRALVTPPLLVSMLFRPIPVYCGILDEHWPDLFNKRFVFYLNAPQEQRSLPIYSNTAAETATKNISTDSRRSEPSSLISHLEITAGLFIFDRQA
jgi:hypothetical protein